eukprot:CAMPEP_0175449634 /NCGR_PEP_ID=MMETSP0095-20121207/61944_1 /TAXON_ID=311494 /ORGANISM="Alexandrium monilatum, Strain CCMP3105" /LENGTH=162 /DNA_ID=CAMNT_0016750059 /DNA_START=13 /DNA_END=497 /DNA_ORIENTATION=+
MAGQLMSQCRELQDRLADQARRHDEHRGEELSHNMGSLKLRTDGLEGRMAKAAERAEAACRPLEAQFKAQLEEQRRWLAGETETRLELLEQRLEAVRQICEDAAEEAEWGRQERGAAPFSAPGHASSRPPRPHREEGRRSSGGEAPASAPASARRGRSPRHG